MNHIEKAINITEAQATVRAMTADEICDLVATLSDKFKRLNQENQSSSDQKPAISAKKAIKMKSIVCLECGRSFKTLSRKHLESHNLTPNEYRDKWGYPRRSPLSCRETSKARSERMKEMKLWTRAERNKPEKAKSQKASTTANPKQA